MCSYPGMGDGAPMGRRQELTLYGGVQKLKPLAERQKNEAISLGGGDGPGADGSGCR